MAKIQLLHDWDWAGAQAQIKQALELDPGYGAALAWAGYFSWAMGQLDRAQEVLQRGVALDPLNPHGYVTLGALRRRMGQLAEAQMALRKALDLNPTAPYAHSEFGRALPARGDPTEALVAFERDNGEKERMAGRALAFHALGRKAHADIALADLEKKYASQDAYDIAEVHAFRGDIDQAIAWLDRAYRQHEYVCAFVKSDPLLKNLWPDPRYAAFLRKMKLPQ